MYRSFIFVIALFLICLSSSVMAIEWNWALYDLENSGSPFSEGLAAYSPSGCRYYGIISTDGKIQIPPKFKRVNEFKRGYAIVQDTLGQSGIINRKGEYTLEPSNYKIEDLKNGFFIITNKDTGLNAIWDGNAFMSSFKYDYITLYGFAVVEAGTPSKEKSIINLMSRKSYPGFNVAKLCLITDGYLINNADTGEFKIFTKEGVEVDINPYLRSSKGNEFYYDASKNMYGIRNIITNTIITDPKYKIPSNQLYKKLWFDDVALVYDSVSPQNNFCGVLVRDDGNVLLREQLGEYLLPNSDYIFRLDCNNFDKRIYYNRKGREITQMRDKNWNKEAEGVYTSANVVFLSQKGKLLSGIHGVYYSEGMLLFRKADDKSYYYNIESDQTFGPFDDADLFSEGVAVAKIGNNWLLVDKKGKRYKLPDYMEFRGTGFSEGVLGAFDKINYKYGYIYNPLGHDNYSYNQFGNNCDIALWNKLYREGEIFSENKKYAHAMDRYYQCMNIDPANVKAFVSYAYSLYNLGYYEQAKTACDIVRQKWPEDNGANLQVIDLDLEILDRIEEIEKREEKALETQENESSYSIWDAIGNFANALDKTLGAYVQSNCYNVYSDNLYNFQNHNSDQSSLSDNLISQYSHWENLAERHYNSLTNLGYSYTSRSGSKSGSTGRGMSSGNYVQMKRSLNEAQTNMRNIRHKARQQGINIPQSKWETARVNY